MGAHIVRHGIIGLFSSWREGFRFCVRWVIVLSLAESVEGRATTTTAFSQTCVFQNKFL